MVDRTVVIGTKTIISGIDKRVVVDESSTSQGLHSVVHFERNLEPDESICFTPKDFIEIRSKFPIKLTLNNNLNIKTRLFIAVSDITSVKILNDNEFANSINVIYG